MEYTAITLEEFKSDFEKYKNFVKEITTDDFKVLWFDDYYDGMLIGMLEYEGEKFRFEIISDYVDNPVKTRIFAVIIMTPKQIEEEISWNQLFQKHVGNHNNFDHEEALRINPQSTHHLFYDEYNKRKRNDTTYEKNVVKYWYIEV